jgi:hypothetical protein
MQGVAYSPDETNEIKRNILKTFFEGQNVTFTAACLKVGLSRTVAYEWRDADPEFDAAIAKAQRMSVNNALDLAENKLMKKIHEEDRKSIFFFLERRGGERGYNPKVTTELTGPGGTAIGNHDITISLVKKNDTTEA